MSVQSYSQLKAKLFTSLSQPFDLTDLDWSLELLIACHDEDEQNARLARHLWEDNGLDVPEGFLDPLLQYLGEQMASLSLSLSPTYLRP